MKSLIKLATLSLFFASSWAARAHKCERYLNVVVDHEDKGIRWIANTSTVGGRMAIVQSTRHAARFAPEWRGKIVGLKPRPDFLRLPKGDLVLSDLRDGHEIRIPYSEVSWIRILMPPNAFELAYEDSFVRRFADWRQLDITTDGHFFKGEIRRLNPRLGDGPFAAFVFNNKTATYESILVSNMKQLERLLAKEVELTFIEIREKARDE